MKGVILFVFGLMVTLYCISAAVSVCSYGVRKNALESRISGILEHTLSEEYGVGDEADVRENLLEELMLGKAATGNRAAEITALDLEKGIIGVRVTETYPQMNGKEKEIVCEKLILVDRVQPQEDRVKVEFWIGDTIYKEYEVEKGQNFRMPIAPDIRLLDLWMGTAANRFVGWALETDPLQTYISGTIIVMEDMRYVAVTE